MTKIVCPKCGVEADMLITPYWEGRYDGLCRSCCHDAAEYFDENGWPPHPLDKPPIVRNTDPPSSHEGAKRIEPKRDTRKGQVLARLREGGWVPAEQLCSKECGGSEGLRRLRELRDDAWDIEVRFLHDKDTMTEYRLREETK